ncbi:MAG: DUF357 domain-containing protein [Zestosphaera sp.]
MASEELAARVRAYIDMVENALKRLVLKSGGREVGEIVGLAGLYLKDAKHYFSVGDYVTSLSCIAYSEGLIDALRMLGSVEVEWTRSRPSRVLIGGTFDILHPGHLHYMREASGRGLVFAVVARDSVVKRVKGRDPLFDERSRLELVSSVKHVYSALLGDEEDFMKPVTAIKPDVILLGADQPVDETTLIKRGEELGLKFTVERLRKRVEGPLMSTSSIVKGILQRYCVNQIQ